MTKALPKLPKLKPATADEKAKTIGSNLSMTVPFGMILIEGDNVRDAAEDQAELKKLAESIRASGLQSPPGVYVTDDGPMLNAGHRRYLALAALGWEDTDPVPVHFLTPPEEAHTRLSRMLAENSNRVNLGPVDEAEAISQLTGFYEQTQAQAGKTMGLHANTVGARLLLLELPADLRSKVNSGEASLDLGQRIGRMIRDGADDKLLAKVLAGEDWFDWKVTELEGKHRRHKAITAAVARLEGRGFRCVASLKEVPTFAGYEIMRGGSIDVSTAAKIREMPHPDQFDSVAYESKPTLLVTTMADGAAVAHTLRSVEVATLGPVDDPGDEWARNQAAMAEVRRRHMNGIIEWHYEDVSLGGGLNLEYVLALHMLGNVNRYTLDMVLEFLGVEPIVDGESGDTDRAATIDHLASFFPDQVPRAVLYANAVAECAHVTAGRSDAASEATKELLAVGLPGPLPDAEFQALMGDEEE